MHVRIKMKVLGESDGSAMPGGLMKYKLKGLLDQPPPGQGLEVPWALRTLFLFRIFYRARICIP